MAKSKVDAAKAVKKEDKKMKGVKDGRVTKSAEAPKASKKAVATELATKVNKKDKKSKKAPTPPSSSSESDSESDASSESESEVETKAAPAKVNGTSKVAAPKDDESSSGSESDESSSESESDEEPAPAKKPALNGTAGKAGKAGKVQEAPSDEDSSSGSDESSDSDEEASPAKAGKTEKATVANGAKASAESSDEDSDDASSEGSDSDSEGSSESEAEAAPAPSKKRKADAADDDTAAKKVKSDLPPNAAKNLFVGSLSWNIDDEWLQSEFAKFGECTGRVMTDRDSGRSKGFGFVEFTEVEDAVKAHDAMKGTELDGRALNVDYSTPRGEVADRSQRVNNRADKFGDAKNPPNESLWVGNISFGATAEMFQEAFAEYGTVTRVHLPTDPESGALKGFGHIGMSTIDEAKAAYEAMNGAEVDGRNIRLDYATPRQENGGGFGGGRGGGRGGGFGGRGGGGGGFRGGRGGFNDRGGRGGRGGGRGRGASRGRGATTNRGGFGDFSGGKTTF